MLQFNITDDFKPYKIGDTERRVWGSYTVLDTDYTGEIHFCEKNITIHPYQALSLQRHQYRAEQWNVLKGTLTTIIDDQEKVFERGESVHVSERSFHCMINLTGEPIVINERQRGLCFEEDNQRFADFNGRKTVAINIDDHIGLKSRELYFDLCQALTLEKLTAVA